MIERQKAQNEERLISGLSLPKAIRTINRSRKKEASSARISVGGRVRRRLQFKIWWGGN